MVQHECIMHFNGAPSNHYKCTLNNMDSLACLIVQFQRNLACRLRYGNGWEMGTRSLVGWCRNMFSFCNTILLQTASPWTGLELVQTDCQYRPQTIGGWGGLSELYIQPLPLLYLLLNCGGGCVLVSVFVRISSTTSVIEPYAACPVTTPP